MSATTDKNSSQNRYATTRCPHPHDTALASVQFLSLYVNWTVCRSVETPTANHLIYYVTRGAGNLQLVHCYCCTLGPHNAADMNRQTQRLLCITRQTSCGTPAHVWTYGGPHHSRDARTNTQGFSVASRLINKGNIPLWTRGSPWERPRFLPITHQRLLVREKWGKKSLSHE